MRIAYITAHYPPDFTSGATLLVDRLARAAATRGHIVEVFSGSIAQGLDDGAERTERTGDITVHWIGTASRVEQDDDRNWINPVAGTVAATWLRSFEPDVIHMHTLQTLGLDVIEAAVAHPAPSVLTMHDMWWWCPRLFLVDRELRPCSLVTATGDCSCARSAGWRSARAARLGVALAGIDQILTPSPSLRDLVIANGVQPDRVDVDENDVAHMLRPGAKAPNRDAPVRFLYVGGPSALKGAETLAAAAQSLHDIAGWTLDAYGLADAPVPSQVRSLAAFEPDQLPQVLAAGDVMVIPSIARESYSLAAREALAAGVAVITSDCLGPEEVVRDRDNGLVVPTGDPDALASAMRQLVDDRSLLARLHRGAAAATVQTRSTDDHVDSLLRTYSALAPVTGGSSRASSRRPDVPVVQYVVGADGAIARYRSHHPREALGLVAGASMPPVAHYLDPGLANRAAGADVVVLQRVPATMQLLDDIRGWRAASKPVVFDTDHLVFDPDLVDEIPTLSERSDAERQLYLDGVRRYRTTLEACDGVTASTEAIAAHAMAVTGRPAAVVPNGLGLVELRLAVQLRTVRRAPRQDHARLAYLSGSDSHQPDFDLVVEPLARALDMHRSAELLVVGPVDVTELKRRFGARVVHRPFQHWRALVTLLADVDINLAPLVLPSRFNAAKSAVKWLEAAILGVPTIASASPAFVDVIDDGRTGVVCPSESEWSEALDLLLRDGRGRVRMGASAQRQAELFHGPYRTAQHVLAALSLLDDARGSTNGARSTWEEVAPDERAPSAPVLDDYDVTIPSPRTLRQRVAQFLRR